MGTFVIDTKISDVPGIGDSEPKEECVEQPVSHVGEGVALRLCVVRHIVVGFHDCLSRRAASCYLYQYICPEYNNTSKLGFIIELQAVL